MVSGWFQVTSNAVLFTGCTFMLTGGVLQAKQQKEKCEALLNNREKTNRKNCASLQEPGFFFNALAYSNSLDCNPLRPMGFNTTCSCFLLSRVKGARESILCRQVA